MDSSKTILQSFKSFFIGTLFTRVLGMLRDVSLAWVFGASIEIASFMVAFRLSNLFRRLFGESSMQSSFSPYFETLRIEDKKKAAFFYRDLLFSLLFILVSIVVIFEIVLFYFMKNNIFSNFTSVFSYTSLMLPGLIFICLYGLDMALLQCEKKYFLPAISPSIFNIVTLITVFLIKDMPKGDGIKILSISVSFSFLLQYLVNARVSFKILSKDINFKSWFQFNLFSKEIKKLIAPIFLSILGIASTQLNSALDVIFAKIADPQSPAYLWYSIRLYQLPLSLFAIGVSQAILPPLTRAFISNDQNQFKNFFNLAIKKSYTLLVPITVGIFILGLPSINLIFNRGSFDNITLIQTNKCLSAYSISLVFSSFIFIIASSFYAKKKYLYPTIASIISIGVNIFLNSIFIFVFNMKASSIALATSISSIINFLILLYFLKKEKKDLFEQKLLKSFFTVFNVSIFAFFITAIFGYLFKDPNILYLLNKQVSFSRNFLSQITSLLSLTSMYFSAVFLISLVTKQKDILNIVKIK
ncbi:MAG: Lipid II flippase MurJ [Candidatus Anoxychlamydiales bacterium]|nr:Lipid II flippase MurJ [Candidatus Anoxychlamydiales bacterium]